MFVADIYILKYTLIYHCSGETQTQVGG